MVGLLFFSLQNVWLYSQNISTLISEIDSSCNIPLFWCFGVNCLGISFGCQRAWQNKKHHNSITSQNTKLCLFLALFAVFIPLSVLTCPLLNHCTSLQKYKPSLPFSCSLYVLFCSLSFCLTLFHDLISLWYSLFYSVFIPSSSASPFSQCLTGLTLFIH